MWLEEYSKKKVARLIQLDGHQVGEGDDVMVPDEDGHCLMAGLTYELRNLSGSLHMPVRVEVCPEANKQEVVSLLRKIADWVDEDWELLRDPDRSVCEAQEEYEHSETRGESGVVDLEERRRQRR